MGHGDAMTPTIVVDRQITLLQAGEIAAGRAHIALSDAATQRCAAAFARLQDVIETQRHVYGVTTGFGPLANRVINARHGATLQQNLVYHLATGVGRPFDWQAARAIVLARLMAIVQGASGARLGTVHRLVALLNSEFAPEIPELGTVGASGDLTPLAHLVLCLQGKGDFLTRHGARVPGETALSELAVSPLDLSHRDGLALVNGTSAMTGVAVLNTLRLKRALDWSVTLSGAMAEVLGGRREAWHQAFAVLRPHPGQAWATERLFDITQGAGCVEHRPLAQSVLSSECDVETDSVAGQDAYSIRCAPQVIGAVRDTGDWLRQVVEIELHAVTDNPIFPATAEAPALHGGNFMGTHIALASDAASSATVVLAGFHERQIARITDEKLNGGLPAFLSGGKIGLTSGLMGAQVTATALLAEMRSIGPASIHSISTNGANQDVVSQGTIAARLMRDKLGLLFKIQAILAITAAQALDLISRDERGGTFTGSAEALRVFVRKTSAFLDDDRPLGAEIDELAFRLQEEGPHPTHHRDG